ncbi:hypothetical protein CCH79_00000651 [Gambusia affinis]|uniref:Peptidase S1 domain-containing protein n=1 Tax=Gambusia affinis TaxID=33528 RepID=A0A315VWB0_GAMAF|nr:hypothetical protein CCH79_00000651 [Gambusia affinis]
MEEARDSAAHRCPIAMETGRQQDNGWTGFVRGVQVGNVGEREPSGRGGGLGTKVQFAGLGATQVGFLDKRIRNSPDDLQCAEFKIAKHAKLEKTLAKDKSFDHSYQKWYSVKSPNTDTAHGDSGGGLVFKNRLYGILSVGGDASYAFTKPSGFTDVCAYKHREGHKATSPCEKSSRDSGLFTPALRVPPPPPTRSCRRPFLRANLAGVKASCVFVPAAARTAERHRRSGAGIRLQERGISCRRPVGLSQRTLFTRALTERRSLTGWRPQQRTGCRPGSTDCCCTHTRKLSSVSSEVFISFPSVVLDAAPPQAPSPDPERQRREADSPCEDDHEVHYIPAVAEVRAFVKREAQGDDLNGRLETEYSNKVRLCVVLEANGEEEELKEQHEEVFLKIFFTVLKSSVGEFSTTESDSS